MRGKYSRKQSGKGLLGGRIRSAEDALKVEREAFLTSTLSIPLLRVKIEDEAHIQYIQSNRIRSKVENERQMFAQWCGMHLAFHRRAAAIQNQFYWKVAHSIPASKDGKLYPSRGYFVHFLVIIS